MHRPADIPPPGGSPFPTTRLLNSDSDRGPRLGGVISGGGGGGGGEGGEEERDGGEEKDGGGGEGGPKRGPGQLGYVQAPPDRLIAPS